MDGRRGGAGRRATKKKVRWKRLIFLVVFLAALFFGGFKLYQAINYLFFTPLDIANITMPSGARLAANQTGRLNLLVLGLDDTPEGENAALRRSDSMLLASFDRAKQTVAVLSIPRDTLAQIPQRPTLEKINHAYAHGGAPLARQAVADFLRAPIHLSLVVDVRGFARLVDALGGVNIYVENDMDYEDPYQDLFIHIKRGHQHMEGATAIRYVRFRSDELGDVGRVLRQQKFLKALADQLFSVGGLLKLPALAPLLEQTLETDVTLPRVVEMARSFRHYSKESINFEMLPGEFTSINDISYWETDREAVQPTLDKLGVFYIK